MNSLWERRLEVEADDGVTLGLWQAGDGPALVLVHGAATDHRCFDPLVEYLASSFTLTAYDRRGHGASGFRDPYAFAHEVADLTAVVAAVGGGDPVAVLGYSYGGAVLLHALSGATLAVRAAVAYEPALPADGLSPAADEIVALVEAERYDEAARLHVTSSLHVGGRALERMVVNPMWQVTLEQIWTLRHEVPVLLDVPAIDGAAVKVPTRVLVSAPGGNPAFREIAAQLQAELPDCDVRTVPGLPHFAISTNPADFAEAVRDHLER